MFTVIPDPNNRLLRIRVDGFWNMATMSAYAGELLRCIRAMKESGDCDRFLVDMGDYPIQSRDVAQGHTDALRYATGKLGARVALVMRSSLSRLQMMRLARDTGHSVFRSEEEALAWLLAPPKAADQP